uniref:myocardin-related transcription factor A-like n=1 Tax=Semicossyphus pulcher TaxID=241346 RepID=UPI0037E85284
MPPLKSSAAFHGQRRSLERAKTEDFLKRKIRSRPERSELIKMHILEETSAESTLQARQLKRARLADDLNDKISHRPGPMELIHKNILPVSPSFKQAIIETQFPNPAGDSLSYDEDSGYSLSPQQPLNQESSLLLLPLPSMPETQHSQLQPNSERSAQKQKKPKDDKPKIKKLKYHQYIPPDHKGDKQPPPHLDSSYAQIVQQQQLVLQLQIINQQQQQQQHCNYHAILPAPPKPDQQSSSSSSPDSTTTSSSPPRVPAPSTAPSNQGSHRHQSSAPVVGTKPTALPPNLGEMKVAELKSELKLRSLPVSGTKVDLIERLRTYQEVNGGSDSTSSLTAGGTTGLTAEAAGKSSRTAATAANEKNTPQQHQTSSLTALFSPTSVSLTPSDCSPGSSSFNCDPLDDMMSSPLTQLSLQPCSAAPLTANIKEEQMCSTSAPCQFSLKPAGLQKHCAASAPGLTTAATAPVVTIDKDKMLKEKDKQIEELTSMLRQIQRVVDVLTMQLERGKGRGQVPKPPVLVRVKQEPPDKPSGPLSFHYPPCKMDVPKVTVKQETIETEEVVSETTVQIPDAHGLPQSSFKTQETQEQIPPQIKSEQTITQTKQQQHVRLQETNVQQAEQPALQKHSQEQQHDSQNRQQLLQSSRQTPENQQNLQKLPQQRKQKHQLRQQQRQQLSRQRQQQEQLKQQVLLKQLRSFLQQQQTEQLQMQTKIHLKQHKMPQANLNQQSGSSPYFSLDVLKQESSPALVTDGNGNHFLIALTSHITENQRTDTPGSKAANHIPLQAQNGGLKMSVDQPQQEVAQRSSGPPAPQPFSEPHETSLPGRNTSSPLTQVDTDTKVIVYQKGEVTSTSKPAADPSLDCLNSNLSMSSPPRFQLHMLSSPSSVPQLPADTAEQKQHLGDTGCGRLEDFLESTTGKPLLGVEPGGPMTLIDDLHSQMLCTPSILDPPPSPMDIFDMAAEREHGLDGMDWLELTVGGIKEEESCTIGPQSPPSVFSTDFLDSSDLQMRWDSCL